MSTESEHSADLQIQPGSLDQLRWFAAGGFLFALLDGSGSEPAAWAQLRRLDDRVVPLIHFPGYKKDASVPHLVQVDPATLEWMVARFWQEPWGIFALSQSDLEHIRLHFRRFLLVQLPNGESRYFRFYDPRVLSMYLQHCMTWELQKFFGPVRGFAISNPASEDIWIVQGAAPAEPPVTSDINDRPTNPRQSLLWQIREEQLRALESASAQDLPDLLPGMMVAGDGQTSVGMPAITVPKKSATRRYRRHTGVNTSQLLLFASL